MQTEELKEGRKKAMQTNVRDHKYEEYMIAMQLQD